ncbi:MAG: GIY-YIG nuclease family protein [Rubrivivax sp.]|nr:GIY-YIG nuclease family protein [Rubrivivax sp.]
MTSATIKLFLPHGDARRLRVGEVSNWTGKALAAPRTELEDLLARDELESSGVYFLLGVNPDTGGSLAYIGEAEVIRERLKQHKAKDFWTSVVVFVSKDENLTKAHVRYLENRLLQEAKAVGRYALENANSSNPKLPESDREDMEVYLARIRQVLPVLGSDLLSPIAGSAKPAHPQPMLVCKIKSALATGRRTEAGFVVFAKSTAVLAVRPSAESQYPNTIALRERLIQDKTLVEDDGLYVFTKDVEFSSPSAAAAVIHGGSANGLTAWRDKNGKSLKEIEET